MVCCGLPKVRAPRVVLQSVGMCVRDTGPRPTSATKPSNTDSLSPNFIFHVPWYTLARALTQAAENHHHRHEIPQLDRTQESERTVRKFWTFRVRPRAHLNGLLMLEQQLTIYCEIFDLVEAHKGPPIETTVYRDVVTLQTTSINVPPQQPAVQGHRIAALSRTHLACCTWEGSDGT